MSSAIRSLKFLPIGDSKDRQRYSDGEIFYDRQEKTLRVYDGVVKGGYKLATEQYVIDNQNLQNIDSDVVPTTANTYNLGSPTKPWKSLYVSTNTIYIGGVAVGVDNGNLTVGDNGNAVSLATEEYVNNQGFITTAALYWNNITSKPVFSSVATSGSYTDLTNKPTLFSGSYTDLTNKPTLFSGSYTDLTNKPTLFSGSYTDLTNKPTIPTTTSQLTNNSGFITSADVGAQVQANWNQASPAEPDYIQNKPAIPTNTNQLTNGAGFVTDTYVNTAIANLVDSSPATLDTLNELAAALGDDPNFATTVSTEIGLKAPINNPTFTGTVSGITATMVGLGNVTNESKATMFTSPTFTGTLTTQQTTEVLNTKTAATGSVIHDFSTGAIWYHSSISANFEPNFTNVPGTNDRTIVCTLILNQGATAYIPSSIRVNSLAMLPPKWLGGTAPTGNANKVDIVSFTLIRTGSAWTVLGSLSSYG